MARNRKPANATVRALRDKLRALAERGIDGERAVARKKLAALEARFDFHGADPAATPDLFQGSFKRSLTALRIFVFSTQEQDVANAVKWAIQSATDIPCVFRDLELWAEAKPATAGRLSEIARHIATSFRALLERFKALEGVTVSDRATFVMGLYDGMMNQTRKVGQRLPSRVLPRQKRKGAKTAASTAAHLDVHPYSLALGLGREIRFAVPVEELAAKLDAACAGTLAAPGAPPAA